jgi:signal transduction histidine kinase
VERPIIAIISDDAAFVGAVTNRWLVEHEVPSFVVLGSEASDYRSTQGFDLAVVGGVSAEAVHSVIDRLKPAGKPVILVSPFNGHSPRGENVVVLPEVVHWPDLLLTVAHQILQRERTGRELGKLQALNSELQRQASLGRYMLDVRHNLNNALTSVLGNSDLILLDAPDLPPATRAQVETIRNMGMRMNEIMHRFSSLQKEMELMEQQSLKKVAGAGQ